MTAQCVLRVVIITEELLANSLTVRLENMWQERFLSPLLGHFLVSNLGVVDHCAVFLLLLTVLLNVIGILCHFF